MKKLILLILFPIILFAQARTLEVSLWGTAADTIGNITKQDTLQYRKYIHGSAGPWNDLTDNYISAAEKTAETAQEFVLSDDANWGWMNSIGFRIMSGNGGVNTEARIYGMGRYYGAFTAILTPDTSGTVTTYTLKVGGN